MHTSKDPGGSGNLPELVSTFLDFCRQSRHLAENSVAAYRQDLNEFTRFAGLKSKLSEIRATDVVSYREYLFKRRDAAPATVKRRLACLRVFFKWSVRTKIVATSPFDAADVSVRLPRRLPRCLNVDEVTALLAHSMRRDDDHLAIGLLIQTGMRVGELASLQRSRIDTVSGAMRILGKGDRERTVYVTDAALLENLRNHLNRGRATDITLLRTRNGSPLSTAAIRRKIIMAGERSGLKRRLTPHMLRHTAATLLMERGVDVRLVQKLLGHRSILTTQIYLHVSDRVLKSAVAAAGVLSAFGDLRP